MFLRAIVIQTEHLGRLRARVSIFCDIQRSGRYAKIAGRYKSAAIEADAVHFSADFLTSSVALAASSQHMPPAPTRMLGGPLAYGAVYSLIDIATTCLILVVVLRMVLRIAGQAAGVLLDRTSQQTTEQIKDIVSGRCRK